MNRDQDFCLSEEPLIGYFSARAAASQNQISYREASAKWALNWLWRFFKKDSTVNLSFTFGWIYPIELCFSKRRRFISHEVVGTLFFPKRGHSEWDFRKPSKFAKETYLTLFSVTQLLMRKHCVQWLVCVIRKDFPDSFYKGGPYLFRLPCI